ncbi:MAG: GGDEF domain-containing protein [Candidatus Omnitrophica bacterium]|nr:GGDEF domain-containing protein [Candidatus Omnitrophota bacterium]
MLILIALFVLAVSYFAKAAVLEFEQRADSDVMRVKSAYLLIIQHKERLVEEKARLQDEADRIFEMYELTREVTATFDENEAFRAFKNHINRRMVLDDCQLIGNIADIMDDLTVFKGYKFFPLRAKKRIIGEVAYKGLATADEETFSILAHQLALALRRIQLYKEVENMAITDGLTRMHTRRYLSERFEEEFNRAKLRKSPLSILMIDVDHFKKVNDQYGHLTGDVILREIARLISLQIREIDIAGRYGGEEFCVILPETDKPGALVVAERIRLAVNAQKIKAYDTALAASVSIGVSTLPDDAGKMDELLDKSDWALYRAKKLGRDRVVGFSVYGDDVAS